ncbi:MAG: ferric uptake regulator family protein [Variovorax paradoxus]|uniref:Ferric uptake regulator family protein n=1 Tax=Variovorax paradoxus TaxID=34073 RepID=A0A2W5SNC5_VARPD|nr:MAG: ferric uptake regulator family protein [Variovorax paradoxus]
MTCTGSASPETGSPTPPQEQRLVANRLRPTLARTGVLSALEDAKPGCLDASQMHRILSRQFGGLRLGSIYRALNDLWMAGILVRTEGAHGRALYAVKPDTSSARYDTLRCHCGARLAFVDDPALRERLRWLACTEGFALDAEPVFSVTTTCAKCRQSGEGTL